MGETERIAPARQMQRRTRPGNDGMVGRESRRLSEPLDESGAPVQQPVDGRTPDQQLEERIRVRAYERYLQRQGQPGSPENDWVEAEREVRGAMWSTRDSIAPST